MANTWGNYGDGLNCDGYSWYSEPQLAADLLPAVVDAGQIRRKAQDGGHPDPQRYFDETADDWVITDNCWAPDTDVEISGSLNECGVGTLTKTVTATDKCGNTSHDTQTLYVKPRSDFRGALPRRCSGELYRSRPIPGRSYWSSGYPEISDDDCELIGVTYSG
ncbi:MAG: hypothetical protein R2806_03050 [Saprospiraceae bacterium]